MGKSYGIKVAEVSVVILSLLAAVWFFGKIDPEVFIKKPKTVVGLKETEKNPQGEYTGKEAGEDIPKLTGRDEFEEMVIERYITVEPKRVVATGIYGRKPWMDPYSMAGVRTSSGRMFKTGRKAPEITDSAFMALDGYQEYYLIELQDGSYILAQFSQAYKRAVEKGEKIPLLVGQRKTNSDSAREYLKEISEKYRASTTYTLYMVDDAWEQEHRFGVFIIKAGIAGVVFLVLSVVILMAVNKVIRRT